MYKKPDQNLLVNVPTGFLKHIADLHDQGLFDTIREEDEFTDEKAFLKNLQRDPQLHVRILKDPELAAKEVQKFHKREARRLEKQKQQEADGEANGPDTTTGSGKGGAKGKGKKGWKQ
jgi:hypothetical protein